METHELFATKERVNLLKRILNHPYEELKVRELAKKVNLSPAFVSKYLKILKKNFNLKENKLELTNPLIKALKILVNMEKLREIITDVRELIPEAIGIGVYGSWAAGTNYEESDVDLWIKVTRFPEDIFIAQLRKRIIEKCNADASILLLEDEKIKQLKKNDSIFYYALIHSFLLWGATID